MVDDPRSFALDMLEKLYVELAKFPGRRDARTTTTSRCRTRCAIACCTAGSTRRARILEGKHRTVIYLSAEYLIGPQLGSNLLDARPRRPRRATALAELGVSLDELIEHEEEPGLGNGGLGRLAACYMDSLATLDIPAVGHGLRYEFGIFDQDIRDGWQVERTDRWLRNGNPWEVRRYEIEHRVGFGGHTEHVTDEHGRCRVRWIPERVVKGVPYDVPVAGYGTPTTNFLRLWSAVADEEFDLDAFQVGEYWRAVDAKIRSENLTKVLYPNDSSPAGKQLRLEQQYFFVSCALQDCIRLLHSRGDRSASSPTRSRSSSTTRTRRSRSPELMRLLVDVHGLGWDDGVGPSRAARSRTRTTRCCPRRSRRGRCRCSQRLLPRHLEIIYEINRRFLDEVRAQFPGDDDARAPDVADRRARRQAACAWRTSRRSRAITSTASPRCTRGCCARPCCATSPSCGPSGSRNVTNGVTPRRFVALANPRLADADHRGDRRRLAARPRPAARASSRSPTTPAFREQLARGQAREQGRARALAARRARPRARSGGDVRRAVQAHPRVQAPAPQPAARDHAVRPDPPRRPTTACRARSCFAGKAAPALPRGQADHPARARRRRGDRRAIRATRDQLRVVFVPDFNVKTAQRIYPAADLSEQISTAGMEASGTGNMKFTLNGALDDRHARRRERRDPRGGRRRELLPVRPHRRGGRRAQARRLPPARRARRGSRARARDRADRAAARSRRGDRGLFAPLVDDLVHRDPFLVLADFRAYADGQRRVAAAWREPAHWHARPSILNVARAGLILVRSFISSSTRPGFGGSPGGPPYHRSRTPNRLPIRPAPAAAVYRQAL